MSRDLLFEIGVEELPAAYIAAGARAARARRCARRSPSCGSRSARSRTLRHAAPARAAGDAASPSASPTATRRRWARRATVAFDADGQADQGAARLLPGQGRGRSPTVRRVDDAQGRVRRGDRAPRRGRPPRSRCCPRCSRALATRLPVPEDDALARRRHALRAARCAGWWRCSATTCCRCARSGSRPGATSRGHRFLRPGGGRSRDAARYLAALEQRERDRRSARLRARRSPSRSSRWPRGAGGRVVADAELLEINNYLVEWPTALRRRASTRATSTCRARSSSPRCASTSASSRSRTRTATLLPAFVARAQRRRARARHACARATQDVLRRAARGRALLLGDRSQARRPPSASRRSPGVVWMEGLGSLREKAARLESLGGWLAERLAPRRPTAAVGARRCCARPTCSAR